MPKNLAVRTLTVPISSSSSRTPTPSGTKTQRRILDSIKPKAREENGVTVPKPGKGKETSAIKNIMFSDGRHKPSVLIYLGLVLCIMWVGVAGVGCQTDGTEANRRRTQTFSSGEKSVDSIHLFTSALLFDLDGKPGPDGFSALVYAVHNGIAKPVKITNGTLEIMLYDGNATPVQSLNPRQVWSYSKTDLPRYLSQTSIGFSYNFHSEDRQVEAVAQQRVHRGEIHFPR